MNDLDSVPLIVNAEVEITTCCDINCWGCDRFCDVAPDGVMTLEQVTYFLQESAGLNWPWERIHLLGGEPTLHPDFQKIVEAFIKYRSEVNPSVFLRVISNGHGNLDRYTGWLQSQKVSVYVAHKIKGQVPYYWNNIRQAPVDEGFGSSLEPCGIFGVRGCGLGVTKYGVFLCGAGAGIARVTGADIGVQALKDVTWDRMVQQAHVLCSMCGHWAMENRTNTKVETTGKVNSPSWEPIISGRARHELTRYGKS